MYIYIYTVVYVGQGCPDALSLGNNLSRCFVF